jgi:hypothetical protein
MNNNRVDKGTGKILKMDSDRKRIKAIFREIFRRKSCRPFLLPISSTTAIGEMYHKLVADPMDIGRLKKNYENV